MKVNSRKRASAPKQTILQDENDKLKAKLMARLVKSAPSDMAFANLNPAVRDALLEDSAIIGTQVNPRRLPRQTRVSLFIADPKKFSSYIPFGSMKVADVDKIAKQNPSLLKEVGRDNSYKFGRYAWKVALKLDYRYFRKILIKEIGQFRQWGHLRQLIVAFPNLITWFDNDTIDAMVLRADSLIHLAASDSVLGKGQVISPAALKHALDCYITESTDGELISTQLMAAVIRLEDAIAGR